MLYYLVKFVKKYFKCVLKFELRCLIIGPFMFSCLEHIDGFCSFVNSNFNFQTHWWRRKFISYCFLDLFLQKYFKCVLKLELRCLINGPLMFSCLKHIDHFSSFVNSNFNLQTHLWRRKFVSYCFLKISLQKYYKIRTLLFNKPIPLWCVWNSLIDFSIFQDML